MTHVSSRKEPWKKVVRAEIAQAVGAIRGSLSKRWRLELECSHVVDRKVLYKPLSNLPEWAPKHKSIFQNRPDSDAEPPPDRVRCPHCKVE